MNGLKYKIMIYFVPILLGVYITVIIVLWILCFRMLRVCKKYGVPKMKDPPPPTDKKVIEILSTTRGDYYVSYNQDDPIGGSGTSRCVMTKTNYGSVVVDIGNGYLKGTTIEVYPNNIKNIRYETN